jgi:DNA excision repair protein ERCC-2
MEEVARALDAGEHLLIEAPTGLGKTAASLFPVLRFALARDKRVFVLTAKTLQQHMAVQVLELLDRDGDFHALQLRAKARMCANGEVLCHEEYCSYAKDYALKLHQSGLVRRMLDEHRVLLPDAVYDAARSETVCPFEVSLELGHAVQVVVGDYNYAFDPYVALSDFAIDQDLSDTILVIDEIHNLVDRGRGYLSPVLVDSAAHAVAEWAVSVAGREGSDRALASRLEELAVALAGVVSEHAQEVLADSADGAAAETLPPEDELWQLRPAFDRAFVDYLEHRRETRSFRSEDPFVGLYFDFLRYLNTLEVASGPAFSHVVRRDGGQHSLAILCKDPSAFLGRTLNRCHAAIGLSATLSPPEFYRDLLGFDPARTSDISLTNPFPKEHRRIVVDAAVTTTYRRRAENYAPIAERLRELAETVPGNCLALFPSYRFLAEVAERLTTSSKRVLVQRRADSEGERQEILATLRSSLFSDILLLAVAGGVFAEGVDYPGDMLQAVAVVGPCLPAVTLEQKLLEAYYEERFARGFEYAFVVPGMTRVVQAAGRLIRSAEDRGVIALFDRRFLQEPYRRHLPADWLPEAGANALVGHPASVAASFFRQPAGA